MKKTISILFVLLSSVSAYSSSMLPLYTMKNGINIYGCFYDSNDNTAKTVVLQNQENVFPKGFVFSRNRHAPILIEGSKLSHRSALAVSMLTSKEPQKGSDILCQAEGNHILFTSAIKNKKVFAVLVKKVLPTGQKHYVNQHSVMTCSSSPTVVKSWVKEVFQFSPL